MPHYRRYFVPAGTYFFTIVTHERRPILLADAARQALHNAIEHVQTERPFDLVAIVLLPDHLHTIWKLPDRDTDYSLRISQIKEHFTRSFLASGGTEGTLTRSRKQKRERAVWQRRFWEHVCVDVDDFKRCLDYIHWNPVKHGFTNRARDWNWSTFRKFVELGEYDLEWGSVDPCPGLDTPEWD